MKLLETGIVKWFDDYKGFGVIARDKGGEIYVHYSAVLCEGIDCSLKEGHRVKITIFKSPKGSQAQNVVVVD
ncbi:MAG: cold-shock protein [Nitrospirae bacterium]|nr:cold-shock protein [Nitrospirota bacterium]